VACLWSLPARLTLAPGIPVTCPLARLTLTGYDAVIPDDIGNLQQLTDLWLWCSSITLPEGISALSRLSS
jgi:hypothetical protein